MTKAQWIDRFVMHLSKLEVKIEPQDVAEIAEELYEAYLLSGACSPEEAAEAEYGEWPPGG